jgi:hypothetical protein
MAARETTGRQGDRVYAHDEYISILNRGVEPIEQ